MTAHQTGLTCGIAFDGMAPFAEVLALASRAEELSVRSLWFAEHFGFRDSVAGCAALLATTRRIMVAPAALSIFAHKPILTAMAARSLEELGPGRVAIGLATGNPQSLRENGIDAARPIAAVKEYISLLRSLLSGQPARSTGQFHRLAGASIRFGHSSAPPLYLAAIGPRMLRLGGAVADGIVLSAGLPRRFLSQSLDWVAEGADSASRDASSIERVGFILTAVHRESASAVDAAKRMLAYLLRNDFIAAALESSQIRVDRDSVTQAALRGDWGQAALGINDDVLRECAVAGTIDECVGQLQLFAEVGIRHLVLVPVSDYECRRLAVELAGAVLE
jgi:5,10-methylenetetrahydromethanopterin reductase